MTLPVGERDHIRRDRPAPRSTLVEYGDYECPLLRARLSDREGDAAASSADAAAVRLSQFPAGRVPPARRARGGGGRGRGRAGQVLGDARLALRAPGRTRRRRSDSPTRRDLSLDGTALRRDELHEHHFAARVREDFLSGVRSGVNGTPTFFINGVRHDGSYDVETLVAAIEGARGR